MKWINKILKHFGLAIIDRKSLEVLTEKAYILLLLKEFIAENPIGFSNSFLADLIRRA